MLDSVLATEKTTRRDKTHSIGEKIIEYSSYSSLPSGHSNSLHNNYVHVQ